MDAMLTFGFQLFLLLLRCLNSKITKNIIIICCSAVKLGRVGGKETKMLHNYSAWK